MNSVEIKAYKCSKCGAAYITKQSANECCEPKFCEDCGIEIPINKYYASKVCDSCKTKRWAEEFDQKEKKRYVKAIKCKYQECPDEHKIMMYSESYGYDEGYFYDIDELIEYCESEDIRVPDYCWSTEQINMSIDADSIIENACEELFEDAESHIDNSDRKELQEFLNKWCAKQTATTTYGVCYKYAIKVEK